MDSITVILRPLLLPKIFLREFLPWYFLWMPWTIVGQSLAYLKAFAEIFSFRFLLRTLFAPWKQIRDPYPKSILHFGEWAQTFTLNCTTRVIGFIFRIVAIALGICAEALVIAFFGLYLFVWLTFPVLFFLEIVTLIQFFLT